MRTRPCRLVDPLHDALWHGLVTGQTRCLETALNFFGSQEDIGRLHERIRRAAEATPIKPVVVDLSPFRSLGAQKRFLSLLELTRDIEFLVVVREAVAYEQLRAIKHVSCVVLDQATSRIKGQPYYPERAAALKSLVKSHLQKTDFLAFRQGLMETELLEDAPGFVRLPPPGKRFIRLHDAAWANKWLDVKSLISDPSQAFRLAYWMAYLVSKGFSRPLDFDSFVAVNNTAYVLAVLLGRIFEDRKVVMVDRLGPIPKLSSLRADALEALRGKKLCMVEDVISAGREVDMLALLGLLRDAEVRTALTVFNLQVAAPLFVDQDRILALCQPRNRLSYRRVPMYAYREDG